jgi:hypothetical protein
MRFTEIQVIIIHLAVVKKSYLILYDFFDWLQVVPQGRSFLAWIF